MSEIQTAVCTKCNVDKALDAFYPSNTKKGHTSQCKECVRTQQAEYHAKPEVKARMRAQQAWYHAEYYARPEVKARMEAQQAEWYAKNKARIRVQQAQYNARPEVKERRKAYKAEWYAKNKARIRAQRAVKRQAKQGN